MAFKLALFGKGGLRRRRAKPDEAAGEEVLFVTASDAGWSAELRSREGVRWKHQSISAPESGAALPPEQVACAVAQLSAEQPQTNVNRVVLLIDDPELQLVDHRFARLTNFEPRAIKDFGADQAGGRPVVFSSIPFGASSAREIEKRVLAFLPEERLENYFFALGKLATALVALNPASADVFKPEAHEGGIFVSLRVHGYFSTVLIANGETGIVAVRHLSFGALALAKAYADEHGLPLEDASTALRTRARLPDVTAVKGEALPEYRTGSFAALAPPLRQLHEDIAATLEYFRYQRLAGRPAHVSLTFTASPVAGLETWLGQALEMQVDAAPNGLPAAEAPADAVTLNLLETSRPGLLKIGHQPFEFSRGRFVAMKGAPSTMQANKQGVRTVASLVSPWLERMRAHSDVNVSFGRTQLKQAVYGVVVAGLLVAGNIMFLTAPAEQRLNDTASAYGAAAGSSVALAKAGSEAGVPESERQNLWADNLLAIGKSLLPAMKLARLELTPAGGKGGPGADLSLAITGALPPGGANLKLVADFIDRLSADRSFARRFSVVRFTGAAESEDEVSLHKEMLFHVVALAGGGKR